MLDAGCGTGLSGPYLRALGYDAIEGLDFSEEMLALAGAAQRLSELKQASSAKTLPWPDGYFVAFLSTGVFTEGHAPASGLDELARITRPGGHAIFTVRDTVLEQGGFREYSNGWKGRAAGGRSRKARFSGPSPLPSRMFW